MENLMQAGGLPSKFQAGKEKKGNALKMKDYNDAPKLSIEVRESQRDGEDIFKKHRAENYIHVQNVGSGISLAKYLGE